MKILKFKSLNNLKGGKLIGGSNICELKKTCNNIISVMKKDMKKDMKFTDVMNQINKLCTLLKKIMLNILTIDTYLEILKYIQILQKTHTDHNTIIIKIYNIILYLEHYNSPSDKITLKFFNYSISFNYNKEIENYKHSLIFNKVKSTNYNTMISRVDYSNGIDIMTTNVEKTINEYKNILTNFNVSNTINYKMDNISDYTYDFDLNIFLLMYEIHESVIEIYRAIHIKIVFNTIFPPYDSKENPNGKKIRDQYKQILVYNYVQKISDIQLQENTQYIQQTPTTQKTPTTNEIKQHSLKIIIDILRDSTTLFEYLKTMEINKVTCKNNVYTINTLYQIMCITDSYITGSYIIKMFDILFKIVKPIIKGDSWIFNIITSNNLLEIDYTNYTIINIKTSNNDIFLDFELSSKTDTYISSINQTKYTLDYKQLDDTQLDDTQKIPHINNTIISHIKDIITNINNHLPDNPITDITVI